MATTLPSSSGLRSLYCEDGPSDELKAPKISVDFCGTPLSQATTAPGFGDRQLSGSWSPFASPLFGPLDPPLQSELGRRMQFDLEEEGLHPPVLPPLQSELGRRMQAEVEQELNAVHIPEPQLQSELGQRIQAEVEQDVTCWRLPLQSELGLRMQAKVEQELNAAKFPEPQLQSELGRKMQAQVEQDVTCWRLPLQSELGRRIQAEVEQDWLQDHLNMEHLALDSPCLQAELRARGYCKVVPSRTYRGYAPPKNKLLQRRLFGHRDFKAAGRLDKKERDKLVLPRGPLLGDEVDVEQVVKTPSTLVCSEPTNARKRTLRKSAWYRGKVAAKYAIITRGREQRVRQARRNEVTL